MESSTAKDLARCIEQTLFAPDASRSDIEKLCAAAREHSFRCVCVNTSRVELAYSLLEDSDVQVAALIGFPLGAADMDAKRYETEIAVDFGANEIDAVINIGRLKDGDRQFVLREMRDLVEAADERTVKLILETHLLNRAEIILAGELALDSGAQFVCTSTDFNFPTAQIDHVKLLRETVGEKFGVKAVGAIRSAATAMALLEAGATRIGTTDGAAILRGLTV